MLYIFSSICHKRSMELLYLSGNILLIKPEKNYFSGIIYKMLKKMLNKTQIGIRPAEKYLDTSKK